MADTQSLSPEELLEILVEAEVLAALNTAEAVKTKLLIVAGLSERIEKRELENEIRDYVAENPWLIAPEWETFKKETGVLKFVREVAAEVGFTKDEYKGRIDIWCSQADTNCLSSNSCGLACRWTGITSHASNTTYG